MGINGPLPDAGDDDRRPPVWGDALPDGGGPPQPGDAGGLDTPLPPMDEAVTADADALPGADEVLGTVATGTWRWYGPSDSVVLDAIAAGLLGLPARPVRLSATAVRSRFHPEDWNEAGGITDLAYAEGTVAEFRMRVMNDRGQELRTIRARCRPTLRRVGGSFDMIGTLEEATPTPAGAATSSAVTGDWRRSREAFLLDAGRELAEARSTAEVLRVAAGLSMPGFSPDGLAVFTAEGDRVRIVGHHGHDPADAAPFVGMSLYSDHPAAEVIRTGRAIYLSSPDEYQRRHPRAWPMAERFGRKSWAVLPLTAGGRMVGAWLAAFAYPVRFTADERSVLTTVARMLAQALARAGAADSQRELAEGIQEAMMPHLGPRVPGLGLAGRYVPTGGGLQVGGDWYDVISLPSGRIALVVGDVQGHDVRAAGVMGQLRIALRAYAAEGHRPEAVLSRASRFLAEISAGHDHQGGPAADGEAPEQPGGRPLDLEDPEGRFATCLYVEVDPVNGALEIARAGHLDPAVRTADGTVLMRPTSGGLPLGIDPDCDYPSTRLVLEPGETMLICTDGLIEADGHDMMSGWKRISSTLEEHGEDGLEALADALVSTAHGPSSQRTSGPLVDQRDDDIAVLLLRRSTLKPLLRKIGRRAALGIVQSEPDRISDVRQQLRELLHDWPSEEQVDSAELLASELLANVLRHTDGDAWVVAEVTGKPGRRLLRVEVTDSSDDLPHKRRPGELASSGRGLVLIEYLADAWGVKPRGEGKSTWFELQEPVTSESEPVMTGTEAAV